MPDVVVGSTFASRAEVVLAVPATSRTRVSTSSSDNCVEFFTLDNNELRSQTAGAALPLAPDETKSQVTNETSASGSAAAGVSSTFATPSVSNFCGLNGGMFGETSGTESG